MRFEFVTNNGNGIGRSIVKFFGLLLIIFSVSCGGGAGGGSGFGGLGGLGGNGATQESNKKDDAKAFEAAGEPIDIPVPIAKGIDPVDATRVSADVDHGGQAKLHIPSPKTNSLFMNVAYADGVDVGICIQGLPDTVLAHASVRAYGASSQLLATITADNVGGFSQCLEAGVGEPVALCVFENGACSAPVIVTVQEKVFPFNVAQVFPFARHNPYTVQITNITDIENKKPNMNAGFVSFNALDAGGTPHLAYVPSLSGGFFENFANLTEDGDHFQVHPSGSVAVYLNQGGDIRCVRSADGQTVTISDAPLLGRYLSLSPNGNYAATETADGEVLIEPVQCDGSVATSSDGIVIGMTGLSEDIECTWVDNNHLLCIREYPQVAMDTYSGHFFVEQYDFSGTNLDQYKGKTYWKNSRGVVNTTDPDISCHQLRNPQVKPITHDEFSFECVRDSGRVDLFTSDFMAAHVVVGESFGHRDLSGSNYAQDGSIVFNTTFVKQGMTEQVVAIFDALAQSPYVLTPGIQAVAHPQDSRLIGYLSMDGTGGLQVSVLNRYFYSLP
ncbi:MAG: hypothetical protein A2048_03680 [Deltaproteobacteria bacterium GWA2_45_12]|nr:MAG: hypothetical protein A2048_03680 [Deltaproteobacteria bacterium GWA2_45_12]